MRVPAQIVMIDRLFDTSETFSRGETLRQFERLFHGVRAVCIHEQRRPFRRSPCAQTQRAAGSSCGSRPIFIFTRGIPMLVHPAARVGSFKRSTLYEVKPPLPYTRHGAARRPKSAHTGNPSSLPLRSHSAISTAEIAIDVMPPRPLLRIFAYISA